MKKLALIFAAMAFLSVAKAQVVVGVQGGYYTQKASNSENMAYQSATSWLAGAQIGYMLTPRLYIGVSGGYTDNKTGNLKDRDSIFYENAPFPNNMIPIMNYEVKTHRTGWEINPMVKYEFVRFGNMHFNLLLQGTIRSMGTTNYKEKYTTILVPNPMELMDIDPYDDSRTFFSWGVSLKPTLVYEFSPHISIEVMFDFLSVGYIDVTETYDPQQTGVTPTKDYNTTFYAGLNTFTETLKWESPLLKFGFNYTF